MKTDQRKELATLLSKIIDGRAAADELQQLEHLLDNNPEAQAYYLRYLAVHCELEQNTAAHQAVAMLKPVAPSKFLQWPLMAAACLVLACTLWISYQWTFSDHQITQSTAPQHPAPDESYHLDQVFAIIGNAENAKWNRKSMKLETGVHLGSGMIVLTQGRIRLDFNQGEQITLEAPAEFEIKSEKLLSLSNGQLVAYVPKTGAGFTVITPTGAVVDLGTEFAINVDQAGGNQVKVLQGSVVASSTDNNGNTAWEETLRKGDEAMIVKSGPLEKNAKPQLYIKHLALSAPPVLNIGKAYSDAVLDSKPVGYWKFDHAPEGGLIVNETGGVPLQLHMRAGTLNHGHGGYLQLGGSQSGFAITADTIPGLNTSQGCSLEFWAYSNSMEWQTLASLTTKPDPGVKTINKVKFRHDPQMILIERAGMSKSRMGHMHPNQSLRCVYRSTAEYKGGSNVYTSHSQLIHRWFHIVVVRNQTHSQIYIDGTLSSEVLIDPQPTDVECLLLIGRHHPIYKQEDTRHWSGAVDEAAVYNRALTAEEVRSHYSAVDFPATQ